MIASATCRPIIRRRWNCSIRAAAAVQTIVNTTPMDGFYRFDARTAAGAPTGDWTAQGHAGRGEFHASPLKIETVMPNRFKVALDMGTDLLGGGKADRGHGAVAVAVRRVGGRAQGGCESAPHAHATKLHRLQRTMYSMIRRASSVLSHRRSFDGELDAQRQGEVREGRWSWRATAAGHAVRLRSPRGCSSVGVRSASTMKRVHSRRMTASSGLTLPKGEGGRSTLQVTDQDHTVRSCCGHRAGCPSAGRKVQRHALQGGVALVVGSERRLAGCSSCARENKHACQRRHGDHGCSRPGTVDVHGSVIQLGSLPGARLRR